MCEFKSRLPWSEFFKMLSDQDYLERLNQLRKSVSRLSVTIEDDAVKLVRVYKATVMRPYHPSTPDGELLDINFNDRLDVFGLNSYNGNDMTIAQDVEAGGGWCQAESALGRLGFVPISFLEFDSVSDRNVTPKSSLPGRSPSFCVHGAQVLQTNQNIAPMDLGFGN
jgi:hypothetical protein